MNLSLQRHDVMTKVFFTNYSIVGRLGPGSWNNEICKHGALSSKAHTSRTEIPGRLISLAMAAADDRAQLSINTTVQSVHSVSLKETATQCSVTGVSTSQQSDCTPTATDRCCTAVAYITCIEIY